MAWSESRASIRVSCCGHDPLLTCEIELVLMIWNWSKSEKEEAKQRVLAFLKAQRKFYAFPDDIVEPRCYAILDEFTMEKDYGWIFFYNSADYLETGNLMLAHFCC